MMSMFMVALNNASSVGRVTGNDVNGYGGLE